MRIPTTPVIFFASSLHLTGCASLGIGVDPGSGSTQLRGLPLKAGITESSVVLRVPVVTEPRGTGGVRSILDGQVEILLTEPDGEGVPEVPLIPNGFVAGSRLRW